MSKSATPLITVFLMTEKGYNFLKANTHIYNSMFALIVVGNDKSIVDDFEDEIIEHCLKNEINFIRRADFLKVETEYVLAISWRWLIKHPQNKLIVIHDSILPKYRGFAPLVNALINGEKKVGVTAIFGSHEFDTGDIIAQSISEINYPIKIYDAIKIVNHNYNQVANSVLKSILNNDITSKPQNNAEATYSVWLDEEDYCINWNKSALEIKRFIDAVGYPYKGAYTKSDGKVIRVLNVEEFADVNIENRHAGKILFVENGFPIVICGVGLLKITQAHIESDFCKESLIPLKKFRQRFHS